MKSKTIVREGVIAEYNGKYWGEEYADHGCKCMNFMDSIEKAEISNPEHCKEPTDKTWTPQHGRYNPDYERLKLARLVKVKITTTYEVEDGPAI